MLKFWKIAVLCAALLFTGALQTFAKQKEPVEKLIAEASAAGDHQAELYARVVQREVEIAGERFNAGDSQAGRAAAAAAVQYGEKSLAAAQQHQKNLKKTEIILHESARSLSTVQQALDYDDSIAVKAAVEQLNKLDSRILEIMFAPPEKK